MITSPQKQLENLKSCILMPGVLSAIPWSLANDSETSEVTIVMKRCHVGCGQKGWCPHARCWGTRARRSWPSYVQHEATRAKDEPTYSTPEGLRRHCDTSLSTTMHPGQGLREQRKKPEGNEGSKTQTLVIPSTAAYENNLLAIEWKLLWEIPRLQKLPLLVQRHPLSIVWKTDFHHCRNKIMPQFFPTLFFLI